MEVLSVGIENEYELVLLVEVLINDHVVSLKLANKAYPLINRKNSLCLYDFVFVNLVYVSQMVFFVEDELFQQEHFVVLFLVKDLDYFHVVVIIDEVFLF